MKQLFSPSNVNPRAKLPWAIWISIIIYSAIYMFVAQFGYMYIIRLNDNPAYLKREELILNEIYWYNIWKKLLNSENTEAYQYFKKSLDSLSQQIILLGSDETIKTTIDSIQHHVSLVRNASFNQQKIEKFQKQFEQKTIELRSSKWEPKISEVAKRSLMLLTYYLFIFIFVTIISWGFYEQASDFSASTYRIFMIWIPALLILITYILMSASGSGRIDLNNFSLFRKLNDFRIFPGINSFLKDFTHVAYITFVIFVLFFIVWIVCNIKNWILIKLIKKNSVKNTKFKLYKYSKSIQQVLDIMIVLLLITLSIICLYTIIKSIPKEIYGIRFSLNTDSKLIVAESRRLELISLELSISMFILIFALFFIFFPIIINSQFQRQPVISSWSPQYQYYIKGIFDLKSIEFTLGLIGSLGILMFSFLYTSASLFSISLFSIGPHCPVPKIFVLCTLIITGLTLIIGPIVYQAATKYKKERNFGLRAGIILFLSIFILFILFVTPNLNTILFFILFKFQSQDIPYHIIKPGALIAIIPFIILWLQPLVVGISDVGNIFSKRTSLILRKLLMELKNHAIVFGYGDLGGKVGRGIVKRYIEPKINDYDFAEIYSTQRNEIIKICKNIVVVDITTATFNETYPDDIYDTIGICYIVSPSKEKKHEIKLLSNIVFLGIKGNCIEPGIHDKINLSDSQCVILSARDDKATFPVFNAVYRLHLQREAKREEIKPKAILGVESSLYGAYLEWRCVDEAIYFVYPAQLRGIVVGEIISDDMINQGLTKNLNKQKILILGSGNKLYYILHTLWEDLRRFFNFNENMANEFLQKNVYLISNDEFIRNIHIPNRRSKWDFWQIRATAIGTPSCLAKDLNIKVLLKNPAQSIWIRPVIERIKPKIIIIAAMTSEETASITHEVLLTLERINRKLNNFSPHIFVGTRRIEWYQIRDALACWRINRFQERSLYPIQQVDSVIDYYDDAAQAMLGLYETIAHFQKEKVTNPIELTVCTTDTPGILAEITANLAGLTFKASSNRNEIIHIPNFHSYRSVNVNSANFSKLITGRDIPNKNLGFCFYSGATLINLKNENPSSFGQIWDNLKNYPRSCIVGAITREDIEEVSKLLKSLFPDQQCLMNKQKCFIKFSCPKRRLCPLDIFRRHLELGRSLPSKFPQDDIKNKKRGREEHYLCNHKDIKDSLRIDIDSQSYAQIAVCGYGAEQYGAMARVVNLLLFRDQVNQESSLQSKSQRILNVTYTRSFGCYEPKRSYQKIYGNLVKNRQFDIKEISEQSFINAILIRPTRGGCNNDWLNYARAVLSIMPDHSEYRIVVGRSQLSSEVNREIILIYRYNEGLINRIRQQHCFGQGLHFDDPDIFLYALRGIYNIPRLRMFSQPAERRTNREQKHLGLCQVRETTCPFEKIRTEAERFGIIWE